MDRMGSIDSLAYGDGALVGINNGHILVFFLVFCFILSLSFFIHVLRDYFVMGISVFSD